MWEYYQRHVIDSHNPYLLSFLFTYLRWPPDSSFCCGTPQPSFLLLTPSVTRGELMTTHAARGWGQLKPLAKLPAAAKPKPYLPATPAPASTIDGDDDSPIVSPICSPVASPTTALPEETSNGKDNDHKKRKRKREESSHSSTSSSLVPSSFPHNQLESLVKEILTMPIHSAPETLICPITKKVMKDPIFAEVRPSALFQGMGS